MELIDVLPNIIIMILVGIVSLGSGVMSYQMYKKLPIKPYYFQSIALIFFGLFAVSVSVALLYDIDFLLQLGILSFCFSLLSYTKFFRELFGKYRDYEILQVLLGLVYGMIILGIYVIPCEVNDYQMIIDVKLFPLFILYAALFFIIVLDYLLFCLKKIRKEHLTRKLLLFCLIFIVSMLSTAIVIILVYKLSLPIFSAFNIQLIFIIIVFVLLKKYPYFNFLALVNPQFLTVSLISGITLYNYQFQREAQNIDMNDLLGGAVSAVNTLFKEAFIHEGIEQIQFRGKVVYCTFRAKFSVIYIDNVFMPFIAKVLNEFADAIEKKYDNAFNHFNGNLSEFDGFEVELHRFFNFLPQLIK